jgi:deferrochelatase/peroxidase EfeB
MTLDRPRPDYESPHQNGITDPLWPVETPAGMSADDYLDYRGRVDPQNTLCVVKANVLAADRQELQAFFRGLTAFVRDNQRRQPSGAHMRPLDQGELPETYRVTITVGLGSTLFVDEAGNDRYAIRGLKPKYLKAMPAFPGDAEGLGESDRGSSLILLIASDSTYISVAVARYFVEHFNANFARHNPGFGGHDIVETLSLESGFQRPDKREFLRFDDGIDNLRSALLGDLQRLVYVSPKDGEPAWCVDGSYLVYRKIRENLTRWEALPVEEQEQMIGRKKATGEPLSREVTGPENLTPVYPDPKDPADGPLNSHVRKVQPRRPEPDLFGLDDTERRFLRRPYPFFEGLHPDGNTIAGLRFFAFMKSIQQQFEHVANMWQLNPDFPVPNTGIDRLYDDEIFTTLGGGYYFCPPAPVSESDYLASGLFA